MSDKTKPETVVHDITTVPADGAAPSVEEKRPNVAVRAFRKIKQTPPKTAIAVVAGVGLVAAGAALGRKTAPLHLEVVDTDLEIPPMLVTPESDTSDDTTVA